MPVCDRTLTGRVSPPHSQEDQRWTTKWSTFLRCSRQILGTSQEQQQQNGCGGRELSCFCPCQFQEKRCSGLFPVPFPSNRNLCLLDEQLSYRTCRQWLIYLGNLEKHQPLPQNLYFLLYKCRADVRSNVMATSSVKKPD